MCTIRKLTEVEYLILFEACRTPLSDYYLSEKGSAVTILGLWNRRGERAGILLYVTGNEVTEILYLGAVRPGEGTATALLGALAAEERQKGRKLLLRVNESHPRCGALRAIAEKQGFRLQDRVEIFRSRREDYGRWLAYMERHGNRILAFLEGQGFEAVPFASADPGLLARFLDRGDPEYDRGMDPAKIVQGQEAYFCREKSWLSVRDGRAAAYCLVCGHNENDYIFEILSARKEYQGTGVIFQPFAMSVRSVGETECGTIEFAMFEQNKRAIALSGRVMKHLISSRSVQYNYMLE